MNFEEHLDRHRNPDGTYDLAAAEADLCADLRSTPDALDELARKAAKHERRAWESSNRDRLHEVFKGTQGVLALDPDQLQVKVPLGGNIAVSLADMDRARVQLRKDLQTKRHLEHNEAWDREMRFWFGVEAVLDPGQIVRDLA